MSSQIISHTDLDGVPGITAGEVDKTYAARRASTAVARHWSGSDPAPQWVKDIAVDLAADYLRNPSGTSSVTRSVDDASRTDRYDSPRRRPAPFELTDDEIRRLTPAGRARRRVGSIRTRVPL